MNPVAPAGESADAADDASVATLPLGSEPAAAGTGLAAAGRAAAVDVGMLVME